MIIFVPLFSTAYWLNGGCGRSWLLKVIYECRRHLFESKGLLLPQSPDLNPFTMPQVILLDVEGTTAPISFVYEKLFPYARKNLFAYLKEHFRDPAVIEALGRLQQENTIDVREGAPLFAENAQTAGNVDSAVAYLLWLMDRDRKTTPLKTIQGLIWHVGFSKGELHSDVFSDVPRCFSEWRTQGLRIAIYSSGSVAAQKLVFEYTPFGSLLPLIDAFFDTRSGPKRDAKSYIHIASELNAKPAEVLFVSDVTAELDAAVTAGMSVALAVRPGNPAQANPSNYRTVTSLADLLAPVTSQRSWQAQL